VCTAFLRSKVKLLTLSDTCLEDTAWPFTKAEDLCLTKLIWVWNEMGMYGPFIVIVSGFIALLMFTLFTPFTLVPACICFKMFSQCQCYGDSICQHWTMIKQPRCNAMEYGVHLKITGFAGTYEISRG